MSYSSLVALASSFCVATIGTWIMRSYALRVSLLDKPVERSLHSTPTPRGGGVAIAVSALITCLVFALAGKSTELLNFVLLALAAAMSYLGFLDDRHSLSAQKRLKIQLLLCFVAMLAFCLLVPLSPLLILSALLLVLFCGWMTNLYNFMDGSDGLAAIQGLTVSVGLASLASTSTIAVPAMALAGACGGFLIFNWQPAKIFMGDVGSVFLGFSFALLALLASAADSLTFLAAVVLHGTFIVDATVTLITRVLRGEKPHVAHRSHTYQRWIQHGKSHRFIALSYASVNLLWLLPMGFFVNQQASLPNQIAFTGLAWAPLLGIALYSKAGFD